MSYEDRGKAISLIADADYDKRYIAVSKTEVDEEFTICAEGEMPIGILQEKTKENTAGPILINGVSFVEAGEAIDAGSGVVVGDDGLGAAAGQNAVNIFGVALNASSAAGDIISVLLQI